MSKTSTRIDALSPMQRKLLEQMLKEKKSRKRMHLSPIDPISRLQDQRVFPMSFAQQRMWFIDQLQPGTCLYNEHGQLHFRGQVNLEVLEATVNEVVRRHESLRTTFSTSNGKPAQIIAPELHVTLPLIDLQGLPEEEKLPEVCRLATIESREPFDLAAGPLLRFKLVRLGAEEHYVFVTMHQIISDGWSVWVFTNEIAAVYEALINDRPTSLPELRLQYTDYAEWQRKMLQGEVLQAQLEFWKEQVRDSIHYLDLPTDRPYSAVETFEGANQSITLSQSCSEAVSALSQAQGVTPFVVLIAAFKILMHRYNGQTDIALSVPVAGRNHVDLEGLIGFFVNVLILRTDLSGNPSFYELMKRLNKSAVGAYANQDLPFEKLIEELHPERNVRRAPFFDVLINFNNLPITPLVLPGLSIRRVDLHEPVSKFHITVYINESEGQFCIRFLYQTELFTVERIESMLEQFRFLIEQAVTDPSRPIESYSLLTPAMCPRFPNPCEALDEPSYAPVTELLRARASEAPEHPALKQGERVMSYGELLRRARLIADALVKGGVERGATVAVQGRRSFGLVAAMLGALMSGGVLLLLDRKLPSGRRRVMHEEARVKALLCVAGESEDEDDLLEGAPSILHLRVSDETGQLHERPDGEQDDDDAPGLPHISPSDPAYIFFTSGTTSVPKGVLGQHRGLSHFVNWQRNAFDIGAQDRCAQLTGLSFDVVLRDVFTPLSSGSTLCLPDDTEDLAADRILPWLQRERITLTHTTPSIAQSWLAHVPCELALPSLRYVFFAGEPLSDVLVHNWRKTFPGATTLVNLYGPTETTLAKTFYVVPSEPDVLPQTQPIGRPLPETQALVLGSEHRLCGPSELGEIAIRTPFRTLGYINDPEESAGRFTPNPFRDDANDLLYRTGDSGRFRLDGSLEIVGRLDNQVKLRGVRVQPDEVTVVLRNHPQVDSCVVTAQKDESGQYTLVAYVVSASEAELSVSALRAYLSAQLPVALIPSAFVFLSKLPLTPNGKLDLRALPPASSAALDAARDFVAPRTAVEELLSETWAKLLGVRTVSIHDNFFELGGHSLLATELMMEVRNVFRLDVPLRRLFEAPTVAGLAEAIELLREAQGIERTRTAALPSISPNLLEKYEPFPLTDVQQAYWVGRSSNFELGQVATHNYSEFEFLDLDLERLNAAFQRLIARHDTLRIVVRSDGQQQIMENAPFYKIELHDLRSDDPRESAERLEAIRQRLSHQVMPLDSWPFFEVLTSRLDEHRYLIHISVDALICDAWSRRTLGRELLRFYQNPEVVLPPLELSFRDYVLAERELRQTEAYKRSEQYWLNRLDDFPPSPQLPLARDPSSITQPRFVRWRNRLDPETWLRLKTRASQAGLTPSGLMCAIYAEILGLWSKSQRFTVNLTLFRRLPLHPQVNDIAGDFTSLVLLTIDPEPTDTFVMRARRIQKQLWTDMDHAYYSGVQVLRELNRNSGGATRALMPVVLTSTLFDERGSRDEFLAAWQDEMRYGISQTPQVYLDHGVSEQGGALVYGWDTVAELFPEGVLEEMFAAYERLLHRLADDDAAWLQRTRGWLLPPAQRQRHAAANATSAPLPQGLLHTAFHQQAALRPDHPALITPTLTLSYAQLQRQASHIARRLRALGITRHDIVAVVMRKGWEQVAAVLGVLEAGAAYLPVDARLPARRRNYLLEVTGVRVALTQAALDATLTEALTEALTEWPEQVSQLVVAEGDADAGTSPPLDALQEPTDLAYVIFTSGSTGLPKGVMISHRAALNTIFDVNTRFDVTPADRVLALSSLSFDLSVYDIFGLLAAGGSIVLPEAEAGRDPRHWLEMMRRAEVTIWDSVPALMEMLVEYAAGVGQQLPESLRLALLSGDWIGLSLPGRVREMREGIEIVSLGGATEASIWSILYRIEEPRSWWRSIPYGRAMVNQQVHVWNEFGEECPDWVAGELYIGGAGVAEGYWGDEERTRAQFLRDEASGERVYRTGDVGRWMGDGEIEFLGREDDQVKVQGHRIELGEVERGLEEHVGVRQAVVIATQAGAGAGAAAAGGNKRLVAYVVPAEGHTLTGQELRAALSQSVPEYMLPSSFVMLPAMLLTANGKIDRKALPDPGEVEPIDAGKGDSFTPVEEVVAAVWSQVLNQEHVGRFENFFELGGDSVIGVQLMSRLQRLFKAELSLRLLFEEQTIAGLAQAVARATGGIDELRASSLQPAPRDAELPLSFAQERLWFLCQMEPESSFYNIPIAIRIKGRLDVEALQKSLDEIVNRHEILKTSFPSLRGKAMVATKQGLRLPLSITDLSGSDPSEMQRLASEEAVRPFNLAEAPLLRAQLLRLGEQEHVLLLTIHHIISDAWSIEVLVNELSTLHSSFANEEGSPLPPLPIQYTDFAYWQRQCMERGLMDEQLAYWREKLRKAPPPLQLNSDRPREAREAHAFRGARQNFSLSPELTTALRAMCRQEGSTLFMALLSAFYLLLHRHSRQHDIVISTSVSNRKSEETNMLIGCFLNTLLMRVTLVGGESFRELLARVRETALEAYTHQDLPFEELVKTLLPGRQLSYAPFSSVVFGLRNSRLSEEQAEGLSFDLLELERHTAKFDLELQMVNKKEVLTGFFDYNAKLFDAAAVNWMVEEFQSILSRITVDASVSVQEIVNSLDAAEQQRRASLPREPAAPPRTFRDIKPKPKVISSEQIVRTSTLSETEGLPLVVEPNANIDLLSWLKANREFVETRLSTSGGILFRNFSIASVDYFEALALSVSGELLEYTERSTPRTQVRGKVYTSTEYPADQQIILHNENSYSHLWPMKLWFLCLHPADEGGETPIADGRRVFELIDPSIRRDFVEKKVMYVRNYRSSLGLSWQEAFQTSDRTSVEQYCRRAGMQFKWINETHLQTRQVRQAVVTHPKTRDVAWFNQAHLFHVSSLDGDVRKSIEDVFHEDEFPRHSYYGDGSPIPAETIAAIRTAYRRASVTFRWQTGDVLLLDNMLAAHGRAPYKGLRKVVVTMAEPFSSNGEPNDAG
jgi:amino acid adenylation domain-containing protein